jgi:hypothetical protein
MRLQFNTMTDGSDGSKYYLATITEMNKPFRLSRVITLISGYYGDPASSYNDVYDCSWKFYKLSESDKIRFRNVYRSSKKLVTSEEL